MLLLLICRGTIGHGTFFARTRASRAYAIESSTSCALRELLREFELPACSAGLGHNYAYCRMGCLACVGTFRCRGKAAGDVALNLRRGKNAHRRYAWIFPRTISYERTSEDRPNPQSRRPAYYIGWRVAGKSPGPSPRVLD